MAPAPNDDDGDGGEKPPSITMKIWLARGAKHLRQRQAEAAAAEQSTWSGATSSSTWYEERSSWAPHRQTRKTTPPATPVPSCKPESEPLPEPESEQSYYSEEHEA